MRQFFKFVLATIVGLFLAFFLFLIIGAAYAGVMAQKSKVKVDPNSILTASFNGPIPETTKSQPLFEQINPMGGDETSSVGLNDLLHGLKKAAKDKNIKGIYLELGGTPNGLATVDELKDALQVFRESGKFVVAYGETITQKGYYLASAADEIYLNPSGLVLLKGFSAELSFYKNMLDRLDVEPEVFYAGKFKSATEPIRYEKMSEANREQLHYLLDELYENYIGEVATARNMTSGTLNNLINNLTVRNAATAKTNNLVDDLLYKDQVLSILREKLGMEEKEDIKSVSLEDYAADVADTKDKGDAEEKVAVIYAQGSIVDGKGDDNSIGSAKYGKLIRKVRRDEDVKAIVLRVNSGGGSALASEIIWRELSEARKQGIPVIASMGDVAASGGYYISCMADTILAEPNTITGSIGVFGLMFDVGKFYNEKLGITFDTVKTAKHSDFPLSGVLSRDLTEEERQIYQGLVDEIYVDFKKRVSEGRNIDTAAVQRIAQGRIWTGKQALERGLVDVLGGLPEAIDIAANMAGLESYDLEEFPKPKDPFKEALKQVFGSASTQSYVDQALYRELGSEYYRFKQLKRLYEMSNGKVQARMPFELEIH